MLSNINTGYYFPRNKISKIFKTVKYKDRWIDKKLCYIVVKGFSISLNGKAVSRTR